MKRSRYKPLARDLLPLVLWVTLGLIPAGCDEPTPPADAGPDAEAEVDADSDAEGDADADADADAEGDADLDGDLPFTPELPPPPDRTATVASKTLGFQLYYRERVDRAVVAYNRFALFGDSGFATNIGNAQVARSGNEYEVIPGPTDNNRIGTSAWMAYNAWRVFRSRELELTLLRMFEGLVFFEAVTGVEGLTSREVYPGWTRVMNGVDGSVSRSRFGAPAFDPMAPSPALEAEILGTFFDGVVFTYRENPAEFLFNFMPLARLEDYAITHSFSELPGYLRVSDCCSSLVRTPDTEVWAGAFWGNHNSRDNFPDLVLGLLAALAASGDAEAPEELRAAAGRAVEAGQRIGDLILESGSAIMTIDEYSDYGELTISGTIRPHGDPENQDLGSLNVCPMTYLAQAVSSTGLSAPAPALPMGLEADFLEALALVTDCEVPEEGATCTSLSDAWCGRQWSNFHHLGFGGVPFLEFLEAHPELAPTLLSSFQNDFDDVVEAMLALFHYATISGDDALYDEARANVFYLTWLQQQMAELAFPDRPDQRAYRRYQAALYQAQAALPATTADFEGFLRSEAEIAQLEGLLDLDETTAEGLLTDEEIRGRIEADLEGTRDTVVARYRAEYGDTPPVRRAGEGYEARGTPEADYPWAPVERPHHSRVGGLRLLNGITLCERAPQVLSCSWAALGCARPDLDGSGVVDGADRAAFEAARGAHEGQSCDDGNGHCGGADLDRDGALTDDDSAFMEAAQGCLR